MEALDLFRQRLSRRPYCADSVREGIYRLPLPDALARRHIQPSTHKRSACLVFDVDRPGAALDWNDRHAPAPSLSAMNPANGHAHLLYLLKDPVAVSDAAHIKPVRYLAAIQEGIRRTLDADVGYSGLICKNPMHPGWIVKEWAGAYSLDELADNVDLPTPEEMRRRIASNDYAGLGRNCTLFEISRKRAYSLVRGYWRPGGAVPFAAAVLSMVEAENATFSVPLAAGECRAIARSVSRWVWQRFNPSEFRAIQAARGRRKGANRRAEMMPQALEMAAAGHTQMTIADTLGVNQSTVSRWLNQ